MWRVIDVGEVRHILGAIARWRCPLCGVIFTHWPDFALPIKRYVRQEIEERVRRYVEDEARTYEEAVRENGVRITHRVEPGCPPLKMPKCIPGVRMSDEPLDCEMSRSTVWRWVGELGRRDAALREAQEVLQRRSPGSDIHRFVLTVRPQKFRLPEREGLIKTAAWWLRAIQEIRGPPDRV